MDREQLGRIVRAAWVQYCIETGDTKPSHLAPWEELSWWDKEADMRIGEAVEAALKGQMKRTYLVDRDKGTFKEILVLDDERIDE